MTTFVPDPTVDFSTVAMSAKENGECDQSSVDIDALPPLTIDDDLKLFPSCSEASSALASCEPDPSSSCCSYSKDVPDPNAIAGCCGLYNLGNTCYMNAGLQCLISTSPLVKYFFDVYNIDPSERKTLLGQFYSLLCRVWGGRYSILHPRDFKNVLGLYHSQFQDYRQHDCQEFLALLLDSLHEQMNKTNLPFSRDIQRDQVQEIFTIEDQSRMNNQSSQAQTVTHKGPTSPHITSVDQSKLNNEAEQASRNDSPMLTLQQHLISEESNQSNASGHSSDSEQCSVIKNLKLQASPVVSQSHDVTGSHDVKSDVSCDTVSSTSVSMETKVHISITSKVHGMTCQKLIGDSVDVDINEDASSSNNRLLDTCVGTDVELVSETDSQLSSTSTENFVLNNVIQTTCLPSLEDLYSKETKTLNTNVLVTEYMHEVVTKDSEKFAKQNNIHRSQNDDIEILNNVLSSFDEKKDDEFGHLKDTNLRAEKKSRYSSGAANYLDDSPVDDGFGFNNVKRMKFEGTEKNLQMQELSKINKNKAMFLERQTSPIMNEVESESDTTEDQDIEVEISDNESSTSELIGPSSSTQLEQYSNLECEASMSAWHEYLSKNNSIIVETFQGQFKSTVVCSECNNVSVTFEPFMYLSVPIPHAMEKQLCVIFLPYNAEPVKYLVTVHVQDRVQNVKQELLAQIGQESCDLIMAEVLDWHISRILEDNMLVRYINDSNRTLYVFQVMSSVVSGDATSQELTSPEIISSAGDSMISRTDQNPETDNDIFSNMDMFSSDILTETTGIDSTTFETNADCDVEMAENNTGSFLNGKEIQSTFSDCHSEADISSGSKGLLDKSSVNSGGKNADISGSKDLLDLSGINPCGKNADITAWGWNDEVSSSSAAEGSTLVEWGVADSTSLLVTLIPEGDESAYITGISSQEIVTRSQEDLVRPREELVESKETLLESSKGEIGQWRSCAICLEELTDNELMVHMACGGTFCPTCLELSVQHNRESAYCCPVCFSPAVMTEDFVPLASAACHKPKTRIVTVPVNYRCDNGDTGNHSLFCHPNILYIPSIVSGPCLYDTIGEISPVIGNFSLHFTDAQGLHCSRCLYMEHCSGCKVERDGNVYLRPGDHLTVSYGSISQEQKVAAQKCHSHKSLEDLRASEPLTLFDCFSCFSQSEILDERNPWFCPQCQKNQSAEKTISVWRCPENLIIQLKRFVFHELSSTKVDSKVVFPLDNLDLSHFISGPKPKQLKYDLYSAVCHYGGANSGHYTAYTRHPLDSKWYYYNDETATELTPREEDYSSAYVLFYQRKGTGRNFRIPENLNNEDSVDPEPVPSSSMVPMLYDPPKEEVTLNDKNKRDKPCQEILVEPDSSTCSLDFYK
ncbi:hypothetical protein CHS0354_018043 [Potamilus streckersoni]|uniref:ubiquitinyl hydrolase 1 n=1 Tax=Potamilus streckersoni TaxID=2493646 RepID=A0AAE0RN50_9BIVA|nr:hypothetical protein CHS0354_018043 [Potamilus streckersoni]